MKKIELKNKLPINTLMGVCYVWLIIYAYMKTDRVINRLVAVITLSAIIDGIYFFMTMRKIDIKLEVNQSIEKNQMFSLHMDLKNQSLLPLYYMCIIPQEGKRFSLHEPNSIGVMLKGRESLSYTILYDAKLCGMEEIGIEKVIYKSFFSFYKKEIDVKEKVVIKILPNTVLLREMQGFTEFISKSIEKEGKLIGTSNEVDGEEEIGYELRPYIEGDSQKLIHWKIAAYKGEFLIRQREKRNENRKDIFFILNPFLDVREEEQFIVQDKLLTSFVSLVSYYLNQGQKVRIAYYQSEKWQYTKIIENVQLRQLQELLGGYHFLHTNEMINQKSILRGITQLTNKKAGIKLVVSNCWSCEMEEYILSKRQISTLSYIWTGSEMSKELIQQSHMLIWHITDDYSMQLPLEILTGIQEVME